VEPAGSATKPTLVYDGACGFCRLWVERWRRLTGDRVSYVAYQEAAGAFPGIPPERFAEAVHLVEPDGRVTRGAEAVFRTLAVAPGRGWLLGLYRRCPGFAPAAEAGYRFVAAHRPAFTRLTRWLWGNHVASPGAALTSWVFLRLLALVYLAAFLSLWSQVGGLVGSRGILPLTEFLRAAHERDGALCTWFSPTLAWIAPGDAMLHGLCAAGTAVSVLLLVGAAPVVSLAALWVLYLSLATVGQDFLWFQWDSLLLETGFLALFLAPWTWWSHPGKDPAPSGIAVWLLRWLCFRLMLASAAVKLLSGDPTWHGLTALRYHFETQPLPPWTAWYADRLPARLLDSATAAVLVIEGIVPFFIFAPRRLRFAAGALLAGLQLLIVVTGNYAFFNWLTLALCLMLLDDGVWPRAWRAARTAADLRSAAGSRARPPRGGWHPWVLRPAAAVLLLLSLVAFLGGLGLPTAWLGPVREAYQLVSPWRSVNHYGLFAVMTTQRPEIILEGSADGEHWEPYEFRYKPGDPDRRPGFVAPAQPRLDWQMWFAALSDASHSVWFLRFCQCLLQGSPPVLSLLEANPFPRSPPRYVRAVVYEYRFTTPLERRFTGAWWRRSPLGLYCPVLTLQAGRLAAVEPANP
jgi:predicted DCC family thiol-disulfide oxidoreductase YuxK